MLKTVRLLKYKSSIQVPDQSTDQILGFPENSGLRLTFTELWCGLDQLEKGFALRPAC